MKIAQIQTNAIKKIIISIPIILTIAIYETIHILLQTDIIEKNSQFFPYWISLHTIPGLVFAYISDRNLRKTMLLCIQTLGIIGGIFLYLFGTNSWVILIFSFAFNVVPVARAALLELFPETPPLKIIAITYLAIFIPWSFYHRITTVSTNLFSLFIILLLLIILCATYYLFKERDFTKEKDIRISPNYIANHMNKRLNLTLIAFILAEAMLYTIWYYEKNTGLNFVWPETMNYANMFGVASILLYNRLPHLSILTLLYTMGFGIFLVAVITCSTGGDSCKTSTLSAVSNICVLSGMILPFITESTIKMFGKRNKALASAILNLCIKMASSIGTLLLIWTNPSPIRIMCITVILLLTAAIFQKIAEKEPSLHAD